MLIALQKRKENIAEYLIYMWQIEDSLRACEFEDDQIEARLVRRFAGMPGMSEEALDQVRDWYMALRDMMLDEGLREDGHLQINKNVIIELTELNNLMLKHEEDAIYTSCYFSTLPYIVDLRSRQGEEMQPEIDTCFTALYGLLLLNLQHKEVSQNTKIALAQVSKFIGLLAQKYNDWKSGELTFPDSN